MNLNNTGSEMLYFLPEIIGNILKRLPVKSLIRFQCVCKDWKTLIKNPSFIADHLQQSSHQNPCLILRCGGIDPPHRSHFCFLDCRLQADVQKAPLNNFLEGARILGSCNGLICLQIYKSGHFLSLTLWNPATSAVRHLPITKPAILRSYECLTGFGFSEVVNDFKIVRTYAVISKTVNQVKVFSLRRGTWKVLLDLANLKDVRLPSEGVTVNGAIFWSGVKQGSEEGEVEVQVIVSFDIANEVFTVIPRPGLDYNAKEKLTVYENKLAILCDMWDYNDETRHWIELWVLDEGTDASGKTWSWTKRYSSIPLSCTIESKAILGNEIVCIPSFTVDNEKGRNVLCLMNLATNEVKRLPVPYCGYFHSMYNYVESLVSVGNN